MDNDEEVRSYPQLLFRVFVCVSLSAVLALQVYGYAGAGAPGGLDRDFAHVKYIVQQLTHSLSEVDRKHEQLKSEMDRVTSVAGRARDALQSSRRPHHLDVHEYDRQVVDFALESAGARVVDTGDTVEHAVLESPVSYALHALSAWMCPECLSARALLRPGALPGECWAFKGPRGDVTVRLLGTILVTGLSIEHIPPQIAPTREISSAPRLFQLEGLEFRTHPYPHDFGSFEYNKDGKPIQYFEVRHPSAKGYNFVRLRVLSNWGHPVYTCVYRLRVHGDLVHGQAPHRLSEEGDLRIDNE